MCSPQHDQLRWLKTALATLASVAFLAGCGEDETPPPTAPAATPGASPAVAGFEASPAKPSTVPPNILTDADVEKAPEGSPQRSVLAWWQAVQFRDVPGAQQFTTKEAVEREGRSKFRRMVLRVGDQLPNLRLLGARVNSDQATVRVFLVFFDQSTATESLAPRSFGLRKVSGQWVLNDLNYLRETYESVVERTRPKRSPRATATPVVTPTPTP